MKHSIQQILFPLLCLTALTLTNSCKEKTRIEGYEWLEGTWRTQDQEEWGTIVVKKDKFKYVSWMYNDSADEINNAQWIPIDIQSRYLSVWENSYLTLSKDQFIIIDDDSKTLILVTGEYSSDTFVKEETTVPEKAAPKNKKKKQIVSKKSGREINSLFSKAFAENEYMFFNTDYKSPGSDSDDIYLVLHPFVFSEDNMRGKAYLAYYGERRGLIWHYVNYYSDYEIVGDYLRLYNTMSIGRTLTPVQDRIYKISSTSSGRITLTGRFIQRDETTTMTQNLGNEKNYSENFRDHLIKTIEKDYCLHKE